jgi:hypothetical protein
MADPHTRAAGSPGYETRDANTTGVIGFLVVLGAVIVMASVICYGLFRYYEKYALNRPATESPFADVRQLPMGPELEANPREDWLKFREEQQKSLETLAWENQSAGTVRVPIEEAMDLLVKKGVPVEAQPAAPAAAEAKRAPPGRKKKP